MKTFKTYIFENAAYTPISDINQYSEVIEYYNNNGPHIFRGMRDTGNYIYFDGNNLNRVSRNTHNLYTILVSESFEKWKDYPKRNKSLICSLDKGIAYGYGTPYQIYPLENQIVGVCPKSDWWGSFHKTLNLYSKSSSLMTFMTDIKNLFLFIEIKINKNLFNGTEINNIFSDKNTTIKFLDRMTTSFIEIMKNEEKQDKFLKQIHYFELKENFFTDITTEKESFYSILEKIFDPDVNGFYKIPAKLLKSKSFSNNHNEVWLSGKCHDNV